MHPHPHSWSLPGEMVCGWLCLYRPSRNRHPASVDLRPVASVRKRRLDLLDQLLSACSFADLGQDTISPKFHPGIDGKALILGGERSWESLLFWLQAEQFEGAFLERGRNCQLLEAGLRSGAGDAAGVLTAGR